MIPEPLSEQPPRPVRRAVLLQRWRDLTMLHWPVEPARVAPLLPPGLQVDVLDGRTWVGLVPFVMAGVRPPLVPPLPWLSGFAETNVRLYAVDRRGRRGVVFRSLDASRLLPVLTGRAALGLPYCWSRMRVRHGPGTVSYEARRRWPGPRGAGGLVRVETGGPLVPGELEVFLSARWGLWSRLPTGRTAWTPVEHPPWPLHAARLLHLDDGLVRAAGLDVAGEPHVMWSPGVDVRSGRPEPLPAQDEAPWCLRRRAEPARSRRGRRRRPTA